MKTQIVKGVKSISKWASKHSSLLLTIGTCAGIGGVIFTTARATLKIKEDLDVLEYDAVTEGGEVSKKDVAISVAKHGWPVMATAGTAVACTVVNHKINTSKILTATTACEFYKNAYIRYKDAVKDKIGEEYDRLAETEAASKRLEHEHPDIYADPSLVPGSGVIFIESISGQVFRSNVDDLRVVEKEFNRDIKGEDWLPINDLLWRFHLNSMDSKIGEDFGFGERYDQDALNIILTPSDKIFATGETATLITYGDSLVRYDDYQCLNV